MAKIRPIYISDDEMDMFTSLLEQMQHGVTDDENNFIASIKLTNEQFETFIGFAEKLCK